MTLRRKLFLFAFLLSTGPLLLVGFVWFESSEQGLIETTYHELSSVNQLSTQLIGEWTEASIALVESLAQRPLVRSYTDTMLDEPAHATEIAGYLREIHLAPALEMQRNLTDLSILDRNGVVRISTNQRLVGQIHDRDDFFLIGQQRSYVSNAVYSASSGQPVMHVGTPIRDQAGHLIAVLSGHLDWQRASDLLARTGNGDGSLESYLVNRHYFMLTGSRFLPDAPLRVLVATEGSKACLEGHDGRGRYPDYRGVEVYGSYTWLPERELCLITEKDVAELATPLQQLKVRFYGITIFLGIGALFIAWGISYTVTTPIRRMASSIRSPETDDRTQPLPVDGSEVGEIARAYNETQAARLAAEQENRHLLDILQHAPQFIAIADPDGRTTYLNQAGRLWLGLKRDAPLNNLLMSDWYPVSDRQQIQQQALPEARQTGFWLGETVFRLGTGGERPAMQLLMVQRDAGGEVSHYAVIAFDLTERKRLEAELNQYQQQLEELVEIRTRAMQHSRARFKAYFENAQIGMAITSLDRTWDEVNDRFCAMLGYSREELTRLTWEEVTHPDDLEADRKEFARLLDGSCNSYSLEKRFVRKDGESIYAMLTVACIRKEDGSPDYFAATVQDITQRKLAELRIEEASKILAASNRELEQFAYVASHDLQEPLRTITSYIQLLERRYRDRLDDEAGEFFAYVVEAAARMKSLINDLLEYSRIGRLENTTSEVDLNQVVAQICSQNRLNIEEAGARIEVGELPSIRGVPAQLAQLFQNLIGNAIKFRREGIPPVVRIEARQVEREWEISVTDNGIGIEPEYHEKIFVIFQRLHTMSEYPGTGIGLALCKKIVDTHQGSITVQSVPGEGTTFIIRLPRGDTP